MPKLLIVFKGNHYSIVKDAFKALFAGKDKFHWNGADNGWFGKDGYVKATTKMETGAPVMFMVECNDKLLDKFTGFCNTNNIEFHIVNSFDTAKPESQPQSTPVPKLVLIQPEYKLDRCTSFIQQMNARKGFSESFISRWSYLLSIDDRRLNDILGNQNDT